MAIDFVSDIILVYFFKTYAVSIFISTNSKYMTVTLCHHWYSTRSTFFFYLFCDYIKQFRELKFL